MAECVEESEPVIYLQCILHYKCALSAARPACFSHLIGSNKQNPRFLFDTCQTYPKQVSLLRLMILTIYAVKEIRSHSKLVHDLQLLLQGQLGIMLNPRFLLHLFDKKYLVEVGTPVKDCDWLLSHCQSYLCVFHPGKLLLNITNVLETEKLSPCRLPFLHSCTIGR